MGIVVRFDILMPVTRFDDLSRSVAAVATEAQDNPSSFSVAGFEVVDAVFTKPDLPDSSSLCVAGEQLSSSGTSCEPKFAARINLCEATDVDLATLANTMMLEILPMDPTPNAPKICAVAPMALRLLGKGVSCTARRFARTVRMRPTNWRMDPVWPWM